MAPGEFHRPVGILTAASEVIGGTDVGTRELTEFHGEALAGFPCSCLAAVDQKVGAWRQACPPGLKLIPVLVKIAKIDIAPTEP